LEERKAGRKSEKEDKEAREGRKIRQKLSGK
jgi:hypothetical protein